MSLTGNLTRALGLGTRPRTPASALYASALGLARDPAWFSAGGVPDTLDGRFDMLALVLSLVILRLQALGLHQTEADLADRFAEDMDASLREIGISDLAISKQVGNTVGALGGRLTAYRSSTEGEDAELADALIRNLYRGEASDPRTLNWAIAQTRALRQRLSRADATALAEGRL